MSTMKVQSDPAPPESTGDERTSGKGIGWVLLGITLTMLLSALDQTVVTTASWPIVKDLDPVHGMDLMPWVVTAYLLASTATQPVYGKVADLFGAKRVYLMATALFLVGSALCGIAGSMSQLIIFRLLQGIGAGGLYSVSLIILAAMVAPRDRAKFQGLAGVVIGLSTVLGPLVGGFLTDRHAILGTHTSWRWVFYINLPLGVLALTAVALTLKLPSHRSAERKPIDAAGALLVMAGTSALLLVAHWGGEKYAWGSAQIVALAVTAVLLLVLFVWRQTKAADPIVPLSLFRNRTVAFALPILLLVGFALMGGVVYIALYLQVVDGLTPTGAGVRLLTMTFGLMVTAIVSGNLIAKRGKFKIFPIIGTALTTIALALLGTLDTHTSTWLLESYLFVLGLGLGLLMQLLVLVVQNAVPEREIGTATTTATFFRTTGQSFGVAVFGALLASRLAHELPAGGSGSVEPGALDKLSDTARSAVLEGFTHALNTVFLVAAAIMFISFVLSFFLKEMELQEIDDFAALDAERAAA